MKKIFCILFILSAIFLISCEAKDTPDTLTSEILITAKAPETIDEAYTATFDEFSEEIKAAMPIIIEEYKIEADANTQGRGYLAKLYNDAEKQLSDICENYYHKMEAHLETYSASPDETYDNWNEKMSALFEKEHKKLEDTYLSSTWEKGWDE